MQQTAAEKVRPWYRQAWPWFLISLPASAVAGGIITLMLAVNSPNALVVDDYYKRGKAINMDLARDRAAAMHQLQAGLAIDLQYRQVTLNLQAQDYELPASVALALLHPTRAGHDQTVQLQMVDAGRYTGTVTELPQGEDGEVAISGPQVMQGYWKRSKETSNVLSNDGWLHTGDIGFIDEDGYVQIVDRKKDMILVSGFNVFPNEVEDVIASHSGVVEVGVIGKPDEYSGEVVMAVVVKSDDSLTEDEIRKYCRESLTSYKVPKSIVFTDELPKTNVGKILRRELRDKYITGT